MTFLLALALSLLPDTIDLELLRFPGWPMVVEALAHNKLATLRLEGEIDHYQLKGLPVPPRLTELRKITVDSREAWEALDRSQERDLPAQMRRAHMEALRRRISVGDWKAGRMSPPVPRFQEV